MSDHIDCCQKSDHPDQSGVDSLPLAMAYVPWQRFRDTYEMCRALQAGTIFPELDLPFLIGRCAQCR